MEKPRKTETNTKLNKSGGIASPNSPSSKRDDGTKQKGTVIREGQVRTTLRDQTMTIVCNISIPVGLEQYNAKEIEEVVFFPFGKDEDLLQNMNTMFKFDYIAATNDSVNGEWIKHDEPTTYTPDLSKCILNKFSLKSKDTLYPGSLKLVSNKEEFNRIIHVDSDSNITKIACPIFRNHQNQKHTLFEMPEHTMDARRSFMIRFPGLCSGDSNNGLISKSKESNTCTVLQGHPLFEFMKTVTSKQTIKPIVHSEPTEGGLGWSTYKLTEYETIENKAIEYKSSILKMVDLGGVCFKLSRLDNKALSDPTGTVYQANPTQFHQIKNFEIALEFKVRISVTVENEFLHGGIIEKLAKTKRVDMGNGLTLSIHGEIAPSDPNPNE